MASIVVYIDAHNDIVSASARFALREARRVADGLGATVYALLALPPTSGERLDGLAVQIGEAGADRVLCCADQVLAGPVLDASHGPLVASVADRLRPNLFLFPTGDAAIQLAPSLAIRTGAAFLRCASVEIDGGSPSRLILRCWRGAHDRQRAVDVRELERPVVATLAAGVEDQQRGEPAAEMEMLACPPTSICVPRLIAASPDPAAEVATTRSLVLVAQPARAASVARLQALLPPDSLAISSGDPRLAGLSAACPERLLIVAGDTALPLPGVAPDTDVALVAGKGCDKEMPCAARSLARPEDGELGGLLGAFEAATNRGEPA
jgi:electron transfer flavoprotein alpha subunit